MPKNNLKDKLDGHELDLSLNDITTVPVKDMAALPKGTHVDLSCNLLTSLPFDFSSLTHIVKLDLSKNQMTSLPDNFGDLQKLQHLDLYGNKLTTIPVSFFRLKNLKWLDLRDNPLNEDIKRIAGDCLNELECKQCAKNVLAYMKNVQADMERNRQKRLQQERELEAAKKAEEDLEKQRKKADKLAEKERRREAYKAKQAAEKLDTTIPKSTTENEHETSCRSIQNMANSDSKKVETKQKSGMSCCGAFLMSFLGLALVVVLAHFYCDTHEKDPVCQDARKHLLVYWNITKQFVERYTER